MSKFIALGAAAFIAFAALDAQAVENSSWNGGSGKVSAAFKERSASEERSASKTARRAAKRELIRQGFISIGTTNTYVSGGAFYLGSPAAPNETNTAAVSNVNIPDARAMTLTMEEVSLISGVEGSLGALFNGNISAKAPTFEFAGIDITSIKVKGAYRAVSNFTRLVGSEKYTISGVIVGGADDGLVVSGSLKIQISARRSTSM